VQITTSDVELTIDGFPCRTYVAAPKPTQSNGKYPGIVLYSEIFQLTGPICRTANRLAGHGFVVAAPEIYHRTCPPGVVIAYDDPGRMYGNYLAHTTPVAHFDATATAVFDHFETRGDVKHDSSGSAVGAIGFCIGGHLALRAALDPRCRAMACAYPTGVHDGKLGADADAGTLARLAEIKAMSILIRRRLPVTSFGRRCSRPECAIPIWNCPANMPSCGTKGRDTIPPWLIECSWRRLGCIGGRSPELVTERVTRVVAIPIRATRGRSEWSVRWLQASGR
jgi:carboxymethylenebutenolidase